MENEILKALALVKLEKQRKFDQTVDMIINLKKFNIKKESINILVQLPFKLKNKKVCGFLTKKSPAIDTLMKPDFEKYKTKKDMKNLTKNYDFFIAHASLMPSIATTFGKYLGPSGKMPTPQLGIIANEDDTTINALLNKINHSMRIKSKEPSLKISIGKASMKDEEIAKNAVHVYNAVLQAVTNEKIKSVLIKYTMTKPIKLKL